MCFDVDWWLKLTEFLSSFLLTLLVRVCTVKLAHCWASSHVQVHTNSTLRWWMGPSFNFQPFNYCLYSAAWTWLSLAAVLLWILQTKLTALLSFTSSHWTQDDNTAGITLLLLRRHIFSTCLTWCDFETSHLKRWIIWMSFCVDDRYTSQDCQSNVMVCLRGLIPVCVHFFNRRLTLIIDYNAYSSDETLNLFKSHIMPLSARLTDIQ